MAYVTVVKASNLFRKGNFKEALKLLSDMEGSDRESPLVLLLMLLCSYQVNSAGELLEKASKSLRSVELFARRPELNALAVQLKKEDNALVPHMMEYCYLSLLLAGEKETDILGMSGKRVLRLNKRKSAFSEMDKEEMLYYRPSQDKTGAGQPYDFDPIEELDDIKVKFKGALDDPEVSALSASATLALDLLTFFARSDEYYGGSMSSNDDLAPFHNVSPHDYWKDKPRKEASPEEYVDSNAKRESAFEKTLIGNVPQTKEEKTKRLNELLLLISNEESAVLDR